MTSMGALRVLSRRRPAECTTLRNPCCKDAGGRRGPSRPKAFYSVSRVAGNEGSWVAWLQGRMGTAPSQTRGIAWRTRAPGPPEPARQINSSLLLIYEPLSLPTSKTGVKMTVCPANFIFFTQNTRSRKSYQVWVSLRLMVSEPYGYKRKPQGQM
jgi:hypothetical protein